MARVVLLLAMAGCAGEWVRDYHGYLPGTDDDVRVFLVVDADTGGPIANATVTRHTEWWYNARGEWAPRLKEDATDEFGLAWLPRDDAAGPCHWAIHADGYAPAGYNRAPRGRVELGRGQEETGRLLRYDGAPLDGARVEFKTCCGDAPALLAVKTGRDGVFTFPRATDGHHFFADPRCRGGDWDEPLARGPAIPTHVTDPGLTITGRVVKPDGTPPAWCLITTVDRGARTRTFASGKFVLEGAYPGATLLLRWGKDIVRFETGDYRPGGPLLIRLERRQPPLGPTERVRVKVAGRPEWIVDVHLDRVADGRRFSAGADDNDTAVLHVPPGAYVLSAGGPFARYHAPDRGLFVRAGTDATLEVTEQPRLEWTRPARDDGFRYDVVLDDRIRAFDPDAPVYLPADAPAWLRVSIESDVYTFPIGPARNGVRSARIRLPGLKHVTVAGREDEGFDTYAVGRQGRLFYGDDGVSRAERVIDLPFAAANLVIDDLEFETPKERTLQVLDSWGRDVVAEVFVRSERPGWGEELDSGKTGEAGRFRSAVLRDGATVRIHDGNHVPFAVTLHGDGPYEVRVGNATIEVNVKGLERACVVFEGRAYHPGDNGGPVVLNGVTAGAHDLVVGAHGRIGKAYRLVLKDGETRRLVPDLRPR